MGIFIKDAKEVKSIFAAVPFQNVNEFSLHGKATQNGTPTPDAPVEIEVSGASYNLLENTATTQTVDGVTFTVNDDKSVTVNGTATKRVNLIVNNTNNVKGLKVGEKYILSGCPKGGTESTYRLQFYKTSSTGNAFDYGDSIEFTFEDSSFAGNIAIAIMEGATVDNLTFYPMIRKATVENDSYMPYGVGSVTVKSVGKNLLNNTATTKTVSGMTFTVNEDKSVGVSGLSSAVRTLELFTTLRAGTYIASGCPKGGANETYSFQHKVNTSNGTLLGRDVGSGVTFTLTEETVVCSYIRIASNYTVNNLTFYPMIRLATEKDGTYEPYKEVTATIPTINGLPGIKVSSGGNYTDSTGQQWICDEIVKYADGSGERIQRVCIEEVTTVSGRDTQGKLATLVLSKTPISQNSTNVSDKVLCDKTIVKSLSDARNGQYAIAHYLTSIYFRNADIEQSINSYNNWLSENPLKVAYALAEPITTPLTAEEIAEIEKLAAICPANNVSVSDDCDLSLLIGKRYETKKIVSAWANKDGVPVKVYSSEKKMFVSVGSDGIAYHSVDNGETWVQTLASSIQRLLNSVTYGKDRFVAVANNGYSYYSLDGKKWNAMASVNFNINLKSVVYWKDRFICAGESADGVAAYYSTDGETWKPYTCFTTYFAEGSKSYSIQYNELAFGNDRLVCTGTYGHAYYTLDGVEWVEMPGLNKGSKGVTLSAIAYGNGRFVAFYGNEIYYCTDGETWVSDSKKLPTSLTVRDVVYGKGQFICVGIQSDATSEAYRSIDGVTWEAMDKGLANVYYYGVTYGNGIFILVGGKYIHFSTDGKTWSSAIKVDYALNSVCYSADGGYDNK